MANSLKYVNRARSFFKRHRLPFVEVPSYQPDPPNCFFKGCWIDKGVLYYCPSRVQVGELLHEMGHLALTPKAERKNIKPGRLDNIYPPLGALKQLGDAAVEAWDYAAAVSLNIPLTEVFHQGFNGHAKSVHRSFDEGWHPGFSLLRLLEMSSSWGTCDRWSVGDIYIPEDESALHCLLDDCSAAEAQGLLKLCEAMANFSKANSI